MSPYRYHAVEAPTKLPEGANEKDYRYSSYQVVRSDGAQAIVDVVSYVGAYATGNDHAFFYRDGWVKVTDGEDATEIKEAIGECIRAGLRKAEEKRKREIAAIWKKPESHREGPYR